eukprot:TRINITY_DN2977_c0_g2_i1.p1 TRINITY_DN2977_c0_g2~~TRINITY_DN2977_c0_g2_i1.p1  ORF type:complete len:339 (+),score=51.14 TRINITY_DN2977_c0_g2_i1:64-1080(+)
MEKFSTWRDPATGIHPFLPFAGKTEYDNIFVKILWILKRTIIGSLLVILRFPLLLVFSILFYTLSFIASLIPVAILRRPIKRIIDAIGARLCLLLMGFHWISSRDVSLSRSKPGTKVTARRIKSGDIMITNHTSYVELLYLTFRFSPVFTAVPNMWKEDSFIGLIPRTFLEALSDIIYFPIHSSPEAQPIDVVLKSANSTKSGPVVIFPEAATTNGRAFIQPVPMFSSLDSCPSVHIFTFKYNYVDFSPAYTAGSFWWHLIRLLAQVNNSMEVRAMKPDETPTLPSSHSPSSSELREWEKEIYSRLVSVCGTRLSSLNSLQKRDFLNYWNSYYKGKKY